MTHISRGIYRDIDKNVGINKIPSNISLDINGGFRGGFTDQEVEGVIRWNDSIKKYQFFDGTLWQDLASSLDPGVVDYAIMSIGEPCLDKDPDIMSQVINATEIYEVF